MWLALALMLPGCALLEGEGSESLTLRNEDVQPLEAIIQIVQEVGEIVIFHESVVLQPRDARGFDLAMRPGDHRVLVTTSTRLQEFLEITIPDTGDTAIDVEFRRGTARITTTSA